MRYFSLLALLAASTSLGGCPSGGDGSALSLAMSGGVCGVNAGQCATAAPVPTTPVVPPTVPVVPTPPPNIGNNNNFTTGDITIALEKSILVSPRTSPAFSKLTIATTGAGGTGPNTAKFDIDPKSPNKGLWPIAKSMDEYLPGTCEDRAVGVTMAGCIAAGGVGGVGLGGTYKEYRAFDSAKGQDEELQVWNWNYSYGTQYRNMSTSGGEANQQAWSAGGTRTAAAAVPTSGTANYTGRFGATAKTWNWVDDPNNTIATLSANNIWRVTGSSNLSIDFATGNFTGVLDPQQWNAWQSRNGAIGFATVDVTLPNTPANIVNTANKTAFMYTDIFLSGTLQADKNSIVGRSNLDQANSLGFITDQGNNDMYAGIFGPTANEITGVFNVNGISPSPTGGKLPINDDRRGFLEMSGVFNGQ
jgi:hypothetical protein